MLNIAISPYLCTYSGLTSLRMLSVEIPSKSHAQSFRYDIRFRRQVVCLSLLFFSFILETLVLKPERYPLHEMSRLLLS